MGDGAPIRRATAIGNPRPRVSGAGLRVCGARALVVGACGFGGLAGQRYSLALSNAGNSRPAGCVGSGAVGY